MKFAIEGQDKDVTIKKYKKIGDSIVVTLLDGSSYKLSNTIENERKIIDLMIKQAKFRDTFSDVQDYKTTEYSINMIYLVSLGIFGISSFAWMNSDDYKGIIYATLCLIAASFSIYTLKVGYDIKSKQKELKKYRMYLETEDLDSEDIYNPDFNINTLDSLSYEKVEERQKRVYKKRLGLNN